MLCAKPWRPNGGYELPCGQCMPCRINKRNIWSTRLLLEDTLHDESSWITLTYNDENLPYREELDKTHYQLWLKRLRKAYPEKKIRYYLCGEYGDDRGRPHFHVVLFGLKFNYRGLAEFKNISRKSNGEYKYPNRVRNMDKDVVKMLHIWNKGNIHFEKPNSKLMSYACSHITKSQAQIDDQEDGRTKTFHAMSQGIGKDAMHAISSWLYTEEGIKEYEKQNDVPSVVRINGKIRPIGKYLRNIIRRNLDLEEKQPDRAITKRGIEHLARITENPDYREEQRKRDDIKARKTLKFNKQRRSI